VSSTGKNNHYHHYRTKVFFLLFGVDHPTISKNFGGRNNYLFFAEIKIQYGIGNMALPSRFAFQEFGILTKYGPRI
jgi:hypothetical protein